MMKVHSVLDEFKKSSTTNFFKLTNILKKNKEKLLSVITVKYDNICYIWL